MALGRFLEGRALRYVLAQSSRITRFFYYQMVGDATFDSGLLNPSLSRRSNYWTYWCRLHPNSSRDRCSRL